MHKFWLFFRFWETDIFVSFPHFLPTCPQLPPLTWQSPGCHRGDAGSISGFETLVLDKMILLQVFLLVPLFYPVSMDTHWFLYQRRNIISATDKVFMHKKLPFRLIHCCLVLKRQFFESRPRFHLQVPEKRLIGGTLTMNCCSHWAVSQLGSFLAPEDGSRSCYRNVVCYSVAECNTQRSQPYIIKFCSFSQNNLQES